MIDHLSFKKILQFLLEGTVGVPRCTVSGGFIFRFLVSEGSYLAVGGGKNGLGGRLNGLRGFSIKYCHKFVNSGPTKSYNHFYER